MYNECTIHIKNIKALMTQIYKLLNDLSTLIINDIFQNQEKYYSLRTPKALASKRKFATMASILPLSEDLKFGKIFLEPFKILIH